jgi:monofunctional glycosyltransferase
MSWMKRRRWRWISIVVLLLAAPMLPMLAFRFVDPPTTAFMLIRRFQGFPIDARWQRLSAMAPVLPLAVVASEDLKFCSEAFGFDMDSINTQIGIWWSGGRPAWASTIAMQTARNLFLWPERGVVRKALEAWLTAEIALVLPRRRQLEIYLNIVEFGPGIFGAEAAAQRWFGLSAAALNLEQAARLIAILPAPLKLSPVSPTLAPRASFVIERIEAQDPRLACAR